MCRSADRYLPLVGYPVEEVVGKPDLSSIQTPVSDSDGDGLSNDLESTIGTNPDSAQDTDGAWMATILLSSMKPGPIQP